MTNATIDPQHIDLTARSEAVARPALEIVFHSDLRRIGDRCAPLTDTLTVGREQPDFGEVPLADPTVSRSQFAVTWEPKTWTFALQADPGARRPLRAFAADLAPVDPLQVPPGGYVVVGDRLALRLDLFGPIRDTLGLLGTSRAMRTLRERIGRVAGVARPTLIQGETGSGKELVARAIHAGSGRSEGPYQVLNCANVPDQLFESELFGHRRGAFTGATEHRDGLFQAADGGSLFLDELGELPLGLQAKLLRAVQEGRVKRVGDVRERSVDVRLIAATHRDLQADVEAGRFREDLYFRLRALRVDVPPLRERRGDVPGLFAHFLGQHGTVGALAHLWREADARPPPVSLEFVLRLMRYDWPGNVRELVNVATETVAENQGAPSFVEPPWDGADLPPSGDAGVTPAPVARADAGPPDAEAVLAALTAQDFRQVPTAKALGISRSTLHRWMGSLDLPRPRDLTADDIEAALEPGDTLASLARRLQVSRRGLKLRVGALGLTPPPDE